MNNSNTPTTPSLLQAVSVSDVLLVTIAVILSATIVSVNSITIIVVKKTHHLRTLSNLCVVSLAVADLVQGLGLIPLSAFYIPSVRKSKYDQDVNACVLVIGINLGMAVTSTIHMALIATDRYVYIVWPYVYQKTIYRNVVYASLGCTWMFGIFYALLPQLIHQDEGQVTKCDATSVLPKAYMFYSNACIYTMCMVVDVIMYTQILITASQKRRQIKSNLLPVTNFESDGSTSDATIEINHHNSPASNFSNRRTTLGNQVYHISNNEIFHQETESPNQTYINPLSHICPGNDDTTTTYSQKQTSKRNSKSIQNHSGGDRMKSVRFFMTVFGVYFICLTPTIVSIGVDYYKPIPRLVYNLFNLLALLNSGMNFFILLSLNNRFRVSVKKLCHGGKRAKHVTPVDLPLFDC